MEQKISERRYFKYEEDKWLRFVKIGDDDLSNPIVRIYIYNYDLEWLLPRRIYDEWTVQESKEPGLPPDDWKFTTVQTTVKGKLETFSNVLVNRTMTKPEECIWFMHTNLVNLAKPGKILSDFKFVKGDDGLTWQDASGRFKWPVEKVHVNGQTFELCAFGAGKFYWEHTPGKPFNAMLSGFPISAHEVAKQIKDRLQIRADRLLYPQPVQAMSQVAPQLPPFSPLRVPDVHVGSLVPLGQGTDVVNERDDDDEYTEQGFNPFQLSSDPASDYDNLSLLPGFSLRDSSLAMPSSLFD